MFQLLRISTTSHDIGKFRRSLTTVAWILLALMCFAHGASSTYAQEPDLSQREQQLLRRTDNRAHADTTKFPFSAVVKLLSAFPDGTQLSCSGALIGPDKVLTADHCVYNGSYGGDASYVEVLPGYANNYTSCHRTYATGWRHSSHHGCHEGAKCDVAVLNLRDSMGCDTGWFGFKPFSDSDLGLVYVAGYPSDRNEGELMYYVGAAAEHMQSGRFHNLLSYQEWTAGGMSGGPIFTRDYYIVGVHTNGGAYANYGIALCNQLFTQIRSWAYN
jgi:glutamyl endopeptidase